MRRNQFSVRNYPRPSAGFTLIELLVVLVIVSIIGIGSYSLLETFFTTDRVLEGRAEEMRRLSMAMYRLDDDLRQLTVRPVKNAYSGYEPALNGQATEFEFTRVGAANLTGEPRGNLQRLHYGIGYLEDDSDSRRNSGDEVDEGPLLLRNRWRVLDRGPDTEPVSEPLLAGVEDMNVRYYDRDAKVWLAQWPPVGSSTATPGAVVLDLPQAIEITLITRTGGEIKRIFSLPDYSGSATGAGGSSSSGGGQSSSGSSTKSSSSSGSTGSGGGQRRGGR